MDKEVKIVPPKGYEIDKENSTVDCIKFKPISKKWRDNELARITGYFIGNASDIVKVDMICHNEKDNYNVFATEKQAKSALAMARISQIMANDKRFGGVVDEEWKDHYTLKYVLTRCENKIVSYSYTTHYEFLAFHTAEQCDLFLRENEDLVKDYLMIK